MSQEEATDGKKFKVMIELKDVGEFKTFPEAFAFFFDSITEMVRKGTTYQMLESACVIHWQSDFDPITGEQGTLREYVLPWYKAKDLAYHLGLITDGKLVPLTIRALEVTNGGIFTVMNDDKEVDAFNNFPEAFAALHNLVEEKWLNPRVIAKKGVGLQDNAEMSKCRICWTQATVTWGGHHDAEENHELDWFKARDLAIYLGLLDEGKLQPVIIM